MRKKIIKIFAVLSLFGILILKLFFIDYMVISGNSMSESYKNREVVLIKKNYEMLNRYDVIVAKTNGTGVQGKVIKRVIGLPNETVQIVDGYVYINGDKLEDDVVNIKMDYAGIAETEITLADDEYFLLGDNRNASEDSRYEWLGIVNEKQIIGKVFAKIYSK